MVFQLMKNVDFIPEALYQNMMLAEDHNIYLHHNAWTTIQKVFVNRQHTQNVFSLLLNKAIKAILWKQAIAG